MDEFIHRCNVSVQRLPLMAKLLIALILALSGLTGRYLKAVGAPGIDFWRPLVAAELAKDQSHFDVYSRSGRERMYELRVLPYLQASKPKSKDGIAAVLSSHFDVQALGYKGIDIVHTPFLLALMRPFTGMSYERAHRLYIIISLLCFFGVSYLLSQLLGFGKPVSLAIGGIAAAGFTAEIADVTIGNVNNFQLGVIALFLWLQKTARSWSDVVSGAVFGLGVGLKPNLGIILPVIGIVWLGERLWGKIARVALGVFAGLFIAWVTPFLVLPAVEWKDWFHVLPQLFRSTQPMRFGNMSLASIVTNMSGIEASGPFTVIGALLVSIVALRPLWMRRLSAERELAFTRTVLGVSAGVFLMLLSSRLVWGHYMVMALPAILYIARDSLDRGGIRFAIGATAILLLSVLLKLTGVPLFPGMMIGNATLVVLLGWVLVDLWNRQHPREFQAQASLQERQAGMKRN